MNSEYAFTSRWVVDASRQRLWRVLEELLASDDPLPWWPSVDVVAYDGRDLTLRARSVLGYAVTFRLTGLERRPPDRLSFDSEGDLRGRGVATFVDLADRCAIDIDWRVVTDRAWMRRTSWLLRPVFRLGHRLVMRQGERHLRAWLATGHPV